MRMLAYDPRLKCLSRRLRREMTAAEQRLWQHLRRDRICGVRFYRQKPLARFIVDFYAPAPKLVVEVDGSQHFEAEARHRDAQRTAALKAMGLTVLRFDNLQVLTQTDAVVEAIWRFCDAAIVER